MNILELIQLLHSKNITVTSSHEKLSIDAPKGAMTPEILALLKNHKQKLINYLSKSKQSLLNIPKIDKSKGSVLSFAQQRLWFIDQMDGGSAHYNMGSAMNITGDFIVAIAEQTFTQIIERHESLRTVFVDTDLGPLQVIKTQFLFEINQLDLTGLPREEQELAIDSALKQDTEKTFNLNEDLMLRVSYLKLDEKQGVMLFNMHHIASDGWSIGILVGEFMTLYHANLAGQVSPLKPLTIQYADYAAWQREWLTGDRLEQQLNYWQKQLLELPQVHSLPLDFERPQHQSYEGDVHHFLLETDTLVGLKSIALEQQVTMFMLVHAVFSVLLSRFSNTTDIVIGTPVANRMHEQLEPLIGFFVNTLVLRADCTGNPKFTDFLQQIKAINLQAQTNQDVPFEQLVDRLKPTRSTSHNALFQIMLSMDNNDDAEFELPGVSLSPRTSKQITTKFDLVLNIQMTDEGLVGCFEFNTSLFNATTIGRMANGLTRLLREIVIDSDRTLAELPVLSKEDIDYQINMLNYTQANYPKDTCIHQLFELQAEKTPHAIAVIFNNQSLTYAELNEQANQLAHFLINNKQHSDELGPDCMVGLCIDRSLHMIVGLMAVLKTGSAYLPLDPNSPKGRLDYMIIDSGLSLVLTEQGLAEKCQAEGCRQVMLDSEALKNSVLKISTENPVVQGLASDNLAYVIYTSGSSGQPKGVMIEHHNAVHSVYARKYFYEEAVRRFLLISPVAFDSSLAGLTWTLLFGGQLIIPATASITDPDALIKLINEHSISHTLMTPALYSALLEIIQPNQIKSLSTVIVAGETFTDGLPKAHQKLLPNTKLYNEYGPTEASVWTTAAKISADSSSGVLPRINIGKPISNTEVFVFDRNQKLLPLGAIGELYIGGAGLARGYLNQDKLTAETFIQHSYRNGINKRLYRTGDLVRYLSDGNLEFIGRADDQIKIRGFRIELGEIAHQLSVHQDVNQSIVLIREDELGHKVLVAYYTTHLDHEGSMASIRDAMQHKLPEYMIPNHFIHLESMPLNANGKVNRHALLEVDLGDTVIDYVKPEGPVEVQLTKIWAKLLKLPEDKISATANFFELGGHSLLSIRLLAEIRNEFDCELSIREVFETPQLAKSACLISTSKSSRRPTIKALKPSRKGILASYAQQRLWFIDKMAGGSAHYNMPTAMQLTGDFRLDVAQKAFVQIIQRHETLRTVFIEGEKGPIQNIRQQFNFSINQIDLSHLPADQHKPAIELAVEEDSTKTFDLTTDLMLRVSYVRTSESNGVLLFNMHHIASDGWSIGLLVEEFVKLYQSILNGQANTLEPLPIQYADFAAWQRRWLKGPVLESQLSYWDQQLKHLPQVHNLPLDYERPEYQSYSGALHHFKLDSKTTDQLKLIAGENQVTLFMLTHAVFSILLARYSNTNDVVIGTPVANRMQKELESLIGFFVNTLVLRADCSSNPTFTAFLQKIKAVNLDAQTNQDVPFEHLVDRLSPERSTNYNALFQILLSMDTNEPSDLNLPNVNLSPLHNENLTALFDLSLYVNDHDGLAFSFEYNTDLFTAQTIKRMTRSLKCLLTGIANDPDCHIAELPLFGAEDKNHLLLTLNDTAVKYPTDLCIHELFEQQVEKTPDNIAVVFADQSITYQALNERANQLAHFLITQEGIKPDNFIGLCVERSIEMMVGLLAILKAGAAYLPLDPSYPEERLEHMLADSKVNILLTQKPLLEALNFKQQKIICIDQLGGIDELPTENLAKDEIGLSSSHLAYIIYTSGSTGKPKGAAVEHKNETNLLYWYIKKYQLNDIDNVLVLSAIGFDLTQKNLFAPLICGASLQFATARLYDVNVISEFIEENQITVTNCAPSVFYPLVEHQKNITQLRSLRCVLFGGEAIVFDRLSQWLSQVPDSFQLINMYGPTECTDISCAYEIPIRQNLSNAPIGTANDNVLLYVLNEHQQLVPFGVTGELCVGGLGVSRGYLNQTRLTNEKFIPNPFLLNQEERIYRTGDLVKWNKEAQLEFIGRIDNQIKIRGFRVELGEIEAVLNSHCEISQSVVIYNPQKQSLNAYIVTKEGAIFDIDEIRQYLQKKLPDHMVPNGFACVDQLPLTTHGKIDKAALSKIAVPEFSRNYINPVGDAEINLTQIWASLLAMDPNEISSDANFFQIGGHSLLLTQMLHLIIEEMNVQLNVKDVFHSPTIKDIAQVISAESSTEVQPLKKQNNKVPLPLSYGQYRIWFIEQIRAQTNEHNIAVAVKIKGDFKPVILEQALNLLIAEHDILRTKIIVNNNNPMQVIEPSFEYQLNLIDLTDLPQPERDDKAMSLTTIQDTQVFDITQLPLLSVLLLKVKQDEYLLHFNQHHIISDGWSQQLFYSELMKGYAKINNQQTINNKTDHFNYADYAVWQQEWLNSEMAEQQRNFWQDYLKNSNEQLQLPIQKREGNLDGQHNLVVNHIDATLRTKLKTIGHQHKGSLFNVLHSGFALLLSRISGEIDFNIGLPVTGRHVYGTQEMLGMFLNTLPIRHKLNLQSSFVGLLKQQILNVEQALSNQDLPLEEIFKVVGCERKADSTPLFQVLFNMLSVPDSDIGNDQFDFSMSLETTAEIQNKFNISLYLKDSEDGLHIICHYNSSVFSHVHMENLIDQYLSLLSQIAENVDETCNTYSLNRGRYKIAYTDTSESTLNDNSLDDVTALFRLQAASFPDAIAIKDEFNEWLYKDLHAYSSGLAYELRNLGVKRGDIVTIMASRQANLAAGILAVLQLGAAYSPVTVETPVNRVIQHLQIVKSSVTLLCEPEACYDAELITAIKVLNQLKVIENNPLHYQSSSSDFTPEDDLINQTACVIFTSGSSGVPKAVEGTHLGLCGYLNWLPEYANFKQSDHFGMLSGLAHDPLQRDIFGALCTGATLVIPSKEQFSAYHFSQWMNKNSVSILHLTPAMAEAICMEEASDLSQLETVFITGEALRKDTVERLLSLNPRLQIYNCYGATETQRAATYFDTANMTMHDSVIPISMSTPDTNIRLINHNNVDCGMGEIGLICTESSRIAKGYLNDPQLTEQRFKPLRNGQRRYITGDMGVCLDGKNIKSLGRQDSQVNIRGFRIELGEIEYQLLQHEQVKSCTALVHNNTFIVAYIVSNDEQLKDAELIEQCKAYLLKNLPQHMLPSSIMVLDKIPLTENRKVDRKALPSVDELFAVTEFHTPVSPTEEKLLSVWSKLLKVPESKISTTANFFELGGHSLLLLKLIVEMRSLFELEISLKYLFEVKDLKAMASFVDGLLEQSNLVEKLSNTAAEEMDEIEF